MNTNDLSLVAALDSNDIKQLLRQWVYLSGLNCHSTEVTDVKESETVTIYYVVVKGLVNFSDGNLELFKEYNKMSLVAGYPNIHLTSFDAVVADNYTIELTLNFRAVWQD